MHYQVILYGASLFMAALEAALKEQAGLSILRIDPAQAGALPSPLFHRPQVVCIEQATPRDEEGAASSAKPPDNSALSETAIVVLSLQSFVEAKQNRHPVQDVNELIDLLNIGLRPNRCR
jgi:hypothetical protein